MTFFFISWVKQASDKRKKIKLVITCLFTDKNLKHTDIQIESKVLQVLGYCMEVVEEVRVSLVFTRCLQVT